MLHHFIDKSERPGIHDVLYADILQECAFFGIARSCKDLGARALCELDCRETDASGRRVDQHSLALAHSGQVIQGIMSRQEGDRNRRCLLEAEVAWLGYHKISRGCHKFAET